MTDRAEQPRIEQRHRDKAEQISGWFNTHVKRGPEPGYYILRDRIAAALAEAEAAGRVALPPEVEAAVREFKEAAQGFMVAKREEADHDGGTGYDERARNLDAAAINVREAYAVLAHVRSGAPVERVCVWRINWNDRLGSHYVTEHGVRYGPQAFCGDCGGKIEIEEAT